MVNQLENQVQNKVARHPEELGVFRIEYPPALPISGTRDEIVAALRAHQVVIISGETGSGKTTQLPKMCVEAGLGRIGKIGCTQPRRIAALSVSRRIAEELAVPWGQQVGCKIRFLDKTSRSTVIKVMTDGILLAETKSDPLLRAYEAIIIDEAHERSLTIDFLLGYLKGLLSKRPELKLIITSATIDTSLFSKAFGNAPIFEVSGRSYPVEIRYAPIEADEDDADETTYVDAAVRVVNNLLHESVEGDVLVFMPSERDIKETRERLAGRYGSAVEVLPLMGSLSGSEQERVFQSTPQRKIIIATNIAETSITLPGIRYVVDTGLVRISRYNARTRTKRLPIERVSKSSANQRAGRAGRVREGICVRLYSEEDFDSRPDYTDPEILRANLAEVILRMKALRLGEVPDFPFLNPPDPRAVRSGILLLQELGALDARHSLTSLGNTLARLPVDPTIGRMLIQSEREHAREEVLIIAAGLSIQDPRERPLEKRERAEELHKKFAHPDSDFLTLLSLWNAFYGEEGGSKSQGQQRKFCKAHFLSYLRMREWGDIYSELNESLAGNKKQPERVERTRAIQDPSTIKRFDGKYRGIHRSILSGLLAQVGYRVEQNTYRASSGRELTLFPGSCLSEKRGRRNDVSSKKPRPGRDPAREQWIMAAEIVETSRLFGGMVAPITPAWIEELGTHLCHYIVLDPMFSPSAGKVTAREQVTLHGLLIASRRVAYERFDADAAKNIFIRQALVPEESPLQFPFIEKNRKLCDKIASHLARTHRFNRPALEEQLVAFYDRTLPLLSSVRDLESFLRTPCGTEGQPGSVTLEATSEYFLGPETSPLDATLFPDSLAIAHAEIPLHYRYDPGGSRDGATLLLPLEIARSLPSRSLDGIIPGFREQQVYYLLQQLPKNLRVQLHPLQEHSKRIAADPLLVEKPLLTGLKEVVERDLATSISDHYFALASLPEHLLPRIEVIKDGEVIHAGRDLATVQQALSDVAPTSELESWKQVRSEWEREGVTSWDLGDLPPAIEVTRIAHASLYAYPGIKVENTGVALRLFDTEEDAKKESFEGMNLLLRYSLEKELLDLSKQSREAEKLKPLLRLYATPEAIREGVLARALEHLVHRQSQYPLQRAYFEEALQNARRRLPNLVPSIISSVKATLELRRSLLEIKHPYSGMRDDLEALLPADFLMRTSFDQLSHLPRYLKAMIVRADRAASDPGKDKVKALQVKPYLTFLKTIQDAEAANIFRWMIEEYKVSVFAQELGTAFPISARRLDKEIEKLRM